MPSYILSGFTLSPPPGLTPGGRLHRFQQRTVDRLADMAYDVGAEATSVLREKMWAAYQEGTGRAAESVDLRVTTDRVHGVRINITMGAFRESRYLTALGGGDFRGGPYLIHATTAEYLSFFWRKKQRVFRGKFVTHPGFPMGDIPMIVLSEYRQIFVERSMQTVSRGLAELTEGSAKKSSTAPTIRRIRR